MDTLIKDPALAKAVEHVYQRFAQYRISGPLEVCLCPVCMTEETRAELVSTPLRQISRDLLAEYTNSAHGVPQDTDQMKYFLPRYLELIAQDDQPDHVGVGTVLMRYGEGLRANPALFSPPEWEVLLAWMRAMVRAIAKAEAADVEEDLLQSHLYLLETLVCAAFPMAEISVAFRDAFQNSEYGAAALGVFAAHLLGANRKYPDGTFFDLFAVGYASDAERAALAGWLGGPEFMASLENAVMGAPDNGLDEMGAACISALLRKLEDGPTPSFPKHR